MPEEERPRLAFWIHQVVEYLVGGFVFVQGVQSSEPLVPALAGLAVIAVAATSQAPLAAFKVVPRAVHRLLDVGLVVLLGVLAVTGWGGLGSAGQFLLGIAAVAMGALLWRTDYRAPVKRSRRRAAAPNDMTQPEDQPTTGATATAPAPSVSAPSAPEQRTSASVVSAEPVAVEPVAAEPVAVEPVTVGPADAAPGEGDTPEPADVEAEPPPAATREPGAGPAPKPPPRPGTGEALGRAAGRVVGQGVNAFRKRKG